MVWTQYPYTNFHELNLDWILDTLKSISTDINDLNEWKATRQERDEYIDRTIEDLNEKYEALMRLYNTFVDEVNLKFDTLERALQKQVDDLEEDVRRQIADLSEDIHRELNNLARDLRAEMADFQTQVNALLNIYNNRILSVEEGLRTVENMIPNMMHMTDPYTGQQNTIVNVIYEIVSRTTTESLTADDYDTMALTATYYDGLAVTAYNYDFHGSIYVQ